MIEISKESIGIGDRMHHSRKKEHKAYSKYTAYCNKKQKKNASAFSFFFNLAPTGVEPVFQSSQDCVLSTKRRHHMTE